MFKMLRVSRFLKIVRNNEGMQLAVNALIAATPQIIRILIITLLFLLIFGIFCVSYLKGRLYDCDTSFVSYSNSLEIQTKWDCLSAGGSWLLSHENFDNIGEAIKTLFIMATTNNWSMIMFKCMQVSVIDQVPLQENFKLFWIFFFIFFILIGSFFLMNLFIGVVVSSFNRQ